MAVSLCIGSAVLRVHVHMGACCCASLCACVCRGRVLVAAKVIDAPEDEQTTPHKKQALRIKATERPVETAFLLRALLFYTGASRGPCARATAVRRRRVCRRDVT